MHAALEAEFESLLVLWRDHDDVRRRRGTIKQLGESRRRLDSARDRVRDLRRALSPREDELVDAAETVMCDALDAPVVIPWLRARREEGGDLVLHCVCGNILRRSNSSAVWQRRTADGG